MSVFPPPRPLIGHHISIFLMVFLFFSATLGCNEDFLVFYPGMQTAGGTLVGSTDTEYTCLERCTAAASCFGIDMVTVAIFVTCSLHTTAALTATPTAAATTNHYRRVCNGKWKHYA